MAELTVYTPEEYLAELLARQAAHEAEHPPLPGKEWARPLLTWFVRATDQVEGIETKPKNAEESAPKRDRRPEYRARLARNRHRLAIVDQRLDRLTSTGRDPAAVNLSPFSRSRAAAAAGRRRMAQLNTDLSRAAELLATRRRLDHRIQLDQQRLNRAEGARRD